MKITDILKENVAALVEFYNDSAACDEANRLVDEVRNLLGPEAPVYRINVEQDPHEESLVRLDTLPTIIIYRNHREEFRITSDFPTAQILAERLKASMQPAGAINPLKGHPRH